MELSFIINDKKNTQCPLFHKTAFFLDCHKKYHFVITMFNQNDSISLISQTVFYKTKQLNEESVMSLQPKQGNLYCF